MDYIKVGCDHAFVEQVECIRAGRGILRHKQNLYIKASLLNYAVNFGSESYIGQSHSNHEFPL